MMYLTQAYVPMKSLPCSVVNFDLVYTHAVLLLMSFISDTG